MSNAGGETKKYTDITQKDIQDYLNDFHNIIRNGYYSIALNEKRLENVQFMEEYNISSEKAKEILLSLDGCDFCYAVDNEKEEYRHEKLYVFSKMYDLDNRGEFETVDIYIKTNKTTTKRGSNFMYVISFHKRNKDCEYLFKEGC